MKTALSARVLLLALAGTLPATRAAAAAPEARTLAAWKAYVEATEARMRAELVSSSGYLASDFTGDREELRRLVTSGSVVVRQVTTPGREAGDLEIPGGTVQHWRGTVFLPGVTLAPLVDALRHPPERGPFQEDVLAMRVERRSPGAMDLFIRMSRTAIVRVTYDTEHHVEFTSRDARRLSTRSISTRITEIDHAGTARERPLSPEDEHGFLWRMNSYWRYEQVDGGVIAEMESLTLSRNIPFALRFLVDPLVDRVAHESVERTLKSFRDLYGGQGAGGA
jgi:hypothetical protein